MWFQSFYTDGAFTDRDRDEISRRRSIGRHARQFRRQMKEAQAKEQEKATEAAEDRRAAVDDGLAKVDGDIAAIDDSIGELALFCHAAVDLMVEKGLITRADVVERMKLIDASDGTVDGKFKPPGEEV